MPDEGLQGRRARRMDTVSAIMLAAAGVASAWATYQATLWGGVQASSYASASAKVTEAARLELQAGQKTGMDTAFYMAWLSAAARDDRELMTFYERRFDPEFRKIFDVWRNQFPADLRGHVREGSNISLPRTEHSESLEAKAMRDEATALFNRAEQSGSTGDRYVASTVTLSLILFLLGISTIARSEGQRRLLVIVAGGLSLATLVFVLTLPVASL
jgi:hypothetical protein